VICGDYHRADFLEPLRRHGSLAGALLSHLERPVYKSQTGIKKSAWGKVRLRIKSDWG
jgi:hypothetical protein